MKCELQPSLLPVQLQGPEQMQVQVLVQVSKPPLLPEMVLLVELVPVSMPDPPVDQTDPLMRSMPNPQLDQTELLPLSVLEQLPVLDPLLKVVPMCKTAAIVSGCYDQFSNLTKIHDRDPVFFFISFKCEKDQLWRFC